TENEFLSLGARLQDFSSRAKSLTEQSAHIAGLFDGNREDNPLNRAGRVSEETLAILKMFDAEAAGATSGIISITEKGKELFKHKRDFNVISRTLHMLGINIKIQGVQIKYGSGSVFLADKVSELTVTTDIIVDKMFDCLKTADASMVSIAERIDKHTKKHHRQVKQTEKRINNALVRLKEMFGLSTALSSNIALRSSEISKKVGEVVMSMQFHDIFRQKMEHVAEAIEDICSKIEEAAFDNGCGQHLAAYTSRISAVQMSQLGLVAHEMEDAEKKMIAALEEIACHTSGQSEDISKMSGAGKTESDDSIIVQFTNEISAVISYLSENAEINRLILEDVKAVSKPVKEISSFVRDVENIAGNIKLLALNAQIEAEHIGKRGLALGVLAREIRDISVQSNLVAGEVSTGVKTILETAEGLQTRIDSILDKGIKETEALKQRGAEAENGLNSLNREMAEHIAEVGRKSKNLALDISALTSEIQFSRKVVECIGHIKETMQDLIETAGPYNLETEAEHNEPALDGLNNRYTMESERIAHEKAFSSSLIEADDKTDQQAESLCDSDALDESHQDTETDGVELFEDFDRQDEQNMEVEIFDQKKENEDDDDLGDNIELF
ncbi:MAG TPA: methyl-accepting chemotaxis protein, partial [Desulfobacteraceae bacterium]|nr:methyl-accepting chemotaxis protein [Desulfobacteraceae bacterium]